MSFLIRFLLSLLFLPIKIFSILMKYLNLKPNSTNLKWVLDFLLFHPFYKLHESTSQLPLVAEEAVQTWNHGISSSINSGSDHHEDVDCAVCLCKICEGEEIRVLRCEHLFHRDCLNRWVGLNNSTCPLCRDFLGGRRATTEVGAEVLFFKFCSFGSDEPETWWLR